MSKYNKKISDNYIKFINYIEDDFNDYKNNMSKKDDLEKQKLTGTIINLCPSDKGPDNSKKFIDYGLVKPQDFKKFKQEFLKKVHFKENRYIVYESAKQLEDNLDCILPFLDEKFEPTIYFTVSSKESEIKKLFIFLRNAFAHGNYYKKDNFYIIFGKTTNGSMLQFFMIIKKIHLNKLYKLLTDFKTIK